MQAELQKKKQPTFDFYKAAITEMFLHSVIQTAATRSRLLVFLQVFLHAVKDFAPLYWGSLHPWEPTSTFLLRGAHVRLSAGLRGVFPQERVGHEPGLCTGQARRPSVYLFHGVWGSSAEPYRSGVCLKRGSVWCSGEPNAVCP